MVSSDEKVRARLDFLEWEVRNRPGRHALRLLGLVLLGYLYPLLLMVGSFGSVVAVLSLAPLAVSSDARVVILYLVALFASLVLAAAILRTFWVSIPVPEGQALAENEARPLRSLVDEVRRSVDGPPIHRIHIVVQLNASVAQRPRFGIWGPRTNYLIIGLPMLIAVTPEQLRAVVAHELGHLRGGGGTFRSWLYRVNQTWETLAGPFAAGSTLRRVVMGWFVRLFGNHLATSTLAIRRLHEYAADRMSAELVGPLTTARALLRIDFAGHRLGKRFWPTVIREAGQNPLPPADVFGRMAQFLASTPEPEVVRCWQQREQRCRTPVTAEHPSLADRLEALGCRAMLDGHPINAAGGANPETDSVGLLGDCRNRVWSIANASWKALAMERWRFEHATVKYMLEKPDDAANSLAGTSEADRQWEAIQIQARYGPLDEAIELLGVFLSRFPEHAAANFTLGQMLLEQDDEDAAAYLETAMRGDSDWVGPALHMLLDYYREAGRDAEADPIQKRLAEHERALVHARTERLKASRRDRFMPHGLDARDLEKLRRILYRYPQIKAAYLVRKEVRTFTDKPSYVLAVQCRVRVLADSRADKFLIESLRSQIPLPCSVVALGWRSVALQSRLRAVCPSPIFSAPD
ncbi:MAG: M48 family metalloprotease [Planctomycetes bacterium]|nr:M48 family metalloprotease [Planctomycetota bacterium]